ncbi:hypothetical protein D3C87_925010 [compost metagenome]
MVRPQGAVFWLVLGALFALLLNGVGLLLPVGLLSSPLHGLGMAFALTWIGTSWGFCPAVRSCWTLGSMLLLGVQLVGAAFGWAHVVAFGALLGMPFWALTAAHPISRLPGLGTALPVGSTTALALATFLAMADVARPADPLVHMGWVYAWGLTVFCVALWHWWGSDLPAERMHRAEAVLLGWMGAVLVIPMRLALLPMLPAEHFGILAGVVDGTAIALLFVSAWAARLVASATRTYERNPQ